MKKNYLKKMMCVFTCMVLGSMALFAQIKTLENGDKISWNGHYYDFKDADGVKMIKLWVPPNTDPVRGIFISGHGGGTGDSRDFARDENIRAFAMRLGFAVAGLHNFPGRQIYDEGAEVFFYALEEFGKLGHHPEIANLPFVIYGSSNGGATTYGFLNYAPERAICFLANVSAGYRPEIPVDKALEVPGIFIIGKFDALVGERGTKATKKLMKYARPKGALWSWALELKGHEDGYSFDVYMKMVEQAVKARYPENGNPKEGKVALKALNEEDGWLVDHNSWDDGIVSIAPYADYKGNKAEAGWVMNRDMAYIYRGLATHHNPLSVSVREFDRTYNPHTDPGTMFSLGGPVINPGEEITITCDAKNFPDWEKIVFYNGAQKLGKAEAGHKPSITINIDKQNMVYCLTALATDADGVQRTSSPMHFFVRNPDLKWDVEEKRDVFDKAKTNAGSKNVKKDFNHPLPDNDDSLLVAYALTAEQEQQFSADDGKQASFWEMIDEDHDMIRLKQRRNATSDAAFNPVLTHDCNMTVKAAYGADGLYLLFTVNDDNDVAWPNKFVATENEQFYHNFDAVDFMIDSRSVKEICAKDNKDQFLSPNFGITTTTKQYQAAIGTEEERPTGFRRSIPDPWDFHASYWTFEEAQKYLGVQVENLNTDYFYKAQEWFIPWSEVGAGLKAEPPVNTRVGFAAGYNDRDAGEHFPPGVTSSGGTVKSSNSLRWINGSDPWGSGPRYGKPPYNWGAILFDGAL